MGWVITLTDFNFSVDMERRSRDKKTNQKISQTEILLVASLELCSLPPRKLPLFS